MIVSRNGLEGRGVRIGECAAWCAEDFANAQVFKRSRRYNGEVAGVKGVRGFRYVCCRIHVVILSIVVLRRLVCRIKLIEHKGLPLASLASPIRFPVARRPNRVRESGTRGSQCRFNAKNRLPAKDHEFHPRAHDPIPVLEYRDSEHRTLAIAMAQTAANTTSSTRLMKTAPLS